MAIKLPDPGNGIPEQKTGNDEWTNMKIVRENFADQSNAASRLVGTNTGDVMAVGAFGLGSANISAITATNINELIDKSKLTKFNFITARDINPKPIGDYNLGITMSATGGADIVILAVDVTSGSIGTIAKTSAGNISQATMYSTKNTTVDSNKNIKTSSPVVRVFSDHLDKIHEANDLPIKYTRNGVGDYTIDGTTGLRENDWQIVIPKDDHDNQLIAFTLEDDKGTIRLKTYKRTFNMTTFMFEPDLNAPLDIPEGRWVDLHFNDLPQEQTDEPTI